VADREAARVLLEADVEAHGAYYGVVCNAGIARDGAFPALSAEIGTRSCTPTWTVSTTYCIR
jgi:hypothetical protein